MHQTVPEGYERHFKQARFTDPWEPLYSQVLDEEVRIGTFITEAHCNSRGFPHGAFLTAIADNAIGLSCGVCLRNAGIEVQGLVTSHLAIDYLDVASMGDWINTETKVVKVGKYQCVAHAMLVTDAGPVARVNANFRNLY